LLSPCGGVNISTVPISARLRRGFSCPR
jgi:hypothetical protein